MKAFSYLFGSTDKGKTWKLWGSFESHAQAYKRMKELRKEFPKIKFEIT